MARKRVKDFFKELIKEQRKFRKIKIRLSEKMVPIEQSLAILENERLINEAYLINIENEIDVFLNAGGEDDGEEKHGEENP